MTLGLDAVRAGEADEDEVMARLRARGWTVMPFGQRAWIQDPAMQHALATAMDLRHAPDILAGHPRHGVFLVEVVRCPKDDVALEVAKLTAMDRWAIHGAPVVFVDVHAWTAWQHRLGWPERLESDAVARWHIGSGDPFAFLSRDGHHTFDAMFGEPT